MIQKPRVNKKAPKPIKPVTNKKTLKKLPSTNRAQGIVNNKAINEAYDRGFNDGYAKGIEDSGMDEVKESD